MSIRAPQGTLNIPNAILRVGKLELDDATGFDTALNTIARNTILLEDLGPYDSGNKQWGLKVPNIFVTTFEIQGVSAFNFMNTVNGDANTGYTLEFSGTTLTLKYDGVNLTTATIPNLDSTYGKVYLTYEKQYFTVTIDGTRVLEYKDTTTRTPPTNGEYINFFAGESGSPRFKNLKIVNGNWITDGTSNISYVGGNVSLSEGLDVSGNVEVGTANLFVDTTTGKVTMNEAKVSSNLEVGTSNLFVDTTTGKVTMNEAKISSNLEVGTSNLFVDTITGRVGIGKTDPGAALDVVGEAKVSSNLEVGTANLFVDTLTGRVGIGVTYPSHALNVKADSGNAEVHIQAQGNDGDAILYFNGSSTNQRKCAIISSNVAPASYCKQDLHFCMETTDDLSDVDITDSKMVITNAGYVGIGKTDPDAHLEVAGIILSHDSYRKYIGVNSVSNTDKVYLGRFSTFAMGYIEIGSEGNSKFSVNNYEIARQFGDSPYVNGINGDYYHDHTFYYKSVDSYYYDLWHTPAGNSAVGNYRYRIRAGNYSFPSSTPSSSGSTEVRYGLISKNYPGSQRVGIGVNNPEATLHVNGAIRSQIPSWGFHDPNPASGYLKFNSVHVTAIGVNVTHNQGSPARTRIHITTTGRYFISFFAFTEYNISAGTVFDMALLRNGYTVCRTYQVQPITNYSATETIAILADAVDGDYFEMSTTHAVHNNANAYFSGYMVG